jgi:outer membrane protein assembly factor BamB
MKRILFVLFLSLAACLADDWPQWFGPQRDGIWRESGILKTFPEGGPKMLWKRDIGAGYAGPSVKDGKVYLIDRTVEDTSTLSGDPFKPGTVPGKERVSCLDATSGKVIWSHAYASTYTVSYGAGPRCTPVIDDGLVYTLGAEGHLHCLQAIDGKVVWEKDFLKVFKVKSPGWGFAATPLVEGDQLICLARGDGSTVVSFDKKTGAERWRALTAKEPGYCPPTIIEAEGKRVLIIWHPEAINGLDPKTGQVLWSVPWTIRSGLCVPTPRLDGKRLFLTSFYNGATMLEFTSFDKEPKVNWQTKRASEKRTEHLNSIIGTPVIKDGHIYGGCSYGQFRCLQVSDGKRLWETMEPIVKKEERWGNVFVTPHEDRYFLFNELGELLIAKLSPQGYEEISRAKLIEPNGIDMMRMRTVVWSHPAYANQNIFVRNDTEIRCFSLKAEG